MFDSSAWELAEADRPVSSPPDDPSSSTLPQHPSGEYPTPAAIALAACTVCQRALGDCAVTSARAGALSPALAVAICTSMQRMVRRAFETRAETLSGYVAYVLFGPARSAAARQSDLGSLAERMR